MTVTDCKQGNCSETYRFHVKANDTLPGEGNDPHAEANTIHRMFHKKPLIYTALR